MTNIFDDTSKEFEAIGIPRHALEKLNEPLARCLHNYFKQIRYGDKVSKKKVQKDKNGKKVDPEKYYIAMAYMIVSESML